MMNIINTNFDVLILEEKRFLVPTRLIDCCYDFNQLKNCMKMKNYLIGVGME